MTFSWSGSIWAVSFSNSFQLPSFLHSYHGKDLAPSIFEMNNAHDLDPNTDAGSEPDVRTGGLYETLMIPEGKLWKLEGNRLRGINIKSYRDHTVSPSCDLEDGYSSDFQDET